jgi:DNA-binding CsgD family transcriptional regulator
LLSIAPIAVPPAGLTALQLSTASLPPSHIAETYASVACDIATRTGSAETRERTRICFRDYFSPLGWNDVLMVNGLDPTGYGCSIGVILPRTMLMHPRMRMTWGRVAAHVAAANRLRRRSTARRADSPDTAEAILTPGGKLEHATEPAQSSEARTELAAGATALDRARGPMRHRDPDRAVAEWRGLIAARWSLTDHVESDGRRYLLARRNDASAGGASALTERERQAVGYASLGHHNKLIAYEMGVSPATVAVLLQQAAQKLGVETRDELIAAYRSRGD